MRTKIFVQLFLATVLYLGTNTVVSAAWIARDFSEDLGTISYFVYAPRNVNANTKVILSLHGCTLGAREFAENARLTELADSQNYVIVAPEQSASRNAFRCWNWFEPAHQERFGGEPEIFVRILDRELADLGLRNAPQYVVGFSAGAAMAMTMGACYRDRFAAVVAGAGLQYRGANSTSSAFLAMSQGSAVPVAESAQAALRCAGPVLASERNHIPPLMVIHGMADTTVAPINSQRSFAQMLIMHDLLDDGEQNGSVPNTPAESEEGESDGGRTFLYSTYRFRGQIIGASLFIDGVSHSWSGGNSGSYMDPSGPNAAAYIDAFFANSAKDSNRRSRNRRNR